MQTFKQSPGTVQETLITNSTIPNYSRQKRSLDAAADGVTRYSITPGFSNLKQDFSKISVRPAKPIATQSGNSAIDQNIHTSAGLKPGIGEDQEDELVGGRTLGESIGDIVRPVDTFTGNVIGSVAGYMTGIDIYSNTNSGPTWTNHGHFDWRVGFSTTGKNGWLIQSIVNTYRAEDSAGKDVRPKYTPSYWEAWAVDGSSKVTPAVGPNNDYWIRPSRGNNTKGHWSMRGKVYFTTTNPAIHGFSPGKVPDAGILLSTTSAPTGLGIARLHRYAQGTWDSTGKTPTHSGSAAP